MVYRYEYIKNALMMSHDYIKRIVEPGDIVIDATAGNGNDTLMLANLVGRSGKSLFFRYTRKSY